MALKYVLDEWLHVSVVNAVTSLHYSLGYLSFLLLLLLLLFMFVFMKWAHVGCVTFLWNLQMYIFNTI
jgi:hypothetical protein